MFLDATRARPRIAALVFSLASAALMLFQLGYGFEVGDQLQYLLLPYRELYPGFMPGDWFTWQTSHYHETFAWAVRGIHALAGDAGFTRGVFALHLLNLCAFGYAIWRLAAALGLGFFEASFTLFCFALVRQMGLAGAVINHAALVPADLALAPFLLACAAYCEQRRLALGAWLGVAGFLHANYAALGPVVLFALEATRVRQLRELRPLAAAAGLFALIAAPTLWLMASAFLVSDAAPAAVAVTLFVRSPHHYDLGAMRPDEFYFAALLFALSLPRWLREVGPAHGYAAHLQLMAATGAALLVGLIGSGLHITSVSRLFAWRMSIPWFALLLLATASALRGFARQRRWLAFAWVVAGCIAMTTFAQSDPLEQSPWNALPLAAASAGAAYALAGLFVLRGLPGRALITPVCSLAAVAIALSVVHTPLWQGERFVPPRGLHWLDGRVLLEARARPLFAQIRAGTPPDARFLIPPGLNQVRMQSRRAIFVDWKCTPMKGDEALEWQRRMLLAMGTQNFPARGYALPQAADQAYNARPLRELAELARAEGLTHVLARGRRSGEERAQSGLRKLFDSADYGVYELQPQ